MLIKKRLICSDKKQTFKPAFTIVELLVVIVVIGILAAISIVSYSGIAQRATAARLQSDLNSNSKLLELYKVEHDEYPRTIDSGTNCPDSPTVDNKYCLKVSEDDDTLTYEGDGGTGGGAGDSYTLTITDNDSDISYEIVPGGVAVAVTPPVAGSFASVMIDGSSDEYGRKIIKTSDGGYALAGSTYSFGAGDYDAFITKMNSSGTITWTKTWGGVQQDDAYDVIETSDNGFAIAGRTRNFSANGFNSFIAKYSSNGTLVWDKTWGGVGDDDAASVVQNSDNSFTIAGRSAAYGAYLAKFGSDGTPIWSKTWGNAATGAIITGMKKTSGDGYVITGSENTIGAGGNDAFIAKIASDGTLTWSKTWGGASSDLGQSIAVDSGGNYIIAGDTSSTGAGNSDAFVAKFDMNGSLLWDRTWGSGSSDWCMGVAIDSDDNVLIQGQSYGFGAGDKDAYIAKFSASGVFAWDALWSGVDYEDTFRSLVQTSQGGGYLAFGDTVFFGYYEYQYDAILLSLGSNGTFDNCNATFCKDPAGSNSDPNITPGNASPTINTPAPTIADPAASDSLNSFTVTALSTLY